MNQQNKSKGYRKFHTRLLYFFDDIEAVEIMDINKENLAGERHIFNGVSRAQFGRLYRRRNTPGSRRNVVSHLKNSVYVSCIKELYEEVMLYLGYVLRSAAMTAPDVNRLIGEQNDIKMKANDILALQSREEIVSVIMGQVFRHIERKKDTYLLINTLNDRLALCVDPEVINAAMPYLEARHIFVHADGIADKEYKKKYSQIKLKEGKIYLDSKVIREYIATAEALVSAFEEKMIKCGYYCDKEYE